MDQNDKHAQEVPEELYAPLGDLTFEKPNEEKEEEVEVLSYKDVKLEYAKKPFNTKKLVTFIVTFLVILLFTVAGYLYEKNNKNVLRKGSLFFINTVEDQIFDIKKSKFLTFDQNRAFRTSLLLSFDTNYDEKRLSKEERELLTVLDDVTVSSTLDFDYKNKQFTHNFKSTYLGGNILEIYGNGYDKGITYKVKDVIGKYIDYPISNFKKFYQDPEENQEEFDEIKKIITKTIFSNIKEKDLKRTKKEIKIGTEAIKVKDVSLSFDQAYLRKVLSKSINELIGNRDFIEKTMNYTNLTETRLKEYLEEIKLYILTNDLFEGNIVIHIYAKGLTSKIIGFEVVQEFEHKNFKLLTDQNILEFEIKKNNEEMLKYRVDNQDKEEKKYEVTTPDFQLNISQFIKDEHLLYDYQLKQGKDKYTGSMIITDEEEKASKDGNVRLTITKFNQQNQEEMSLYTTLNYSVKITNTIKPYDDENKVPFEDLTEEDKKEMKSRIENAEYFALLKEKIENYLKKK